ncbi:uncharacterized protein NKAPD1 [Myripristis murdjan]|uniref:NKAP domain containing 1 n=1 Tax=Myripristis murdjan TaxID=586833 RepID=A0A667XX53_9TELE|nr:uncharacterized protein NKAPD1 [Myripristis murdjan]
MSKVTGKVLLRNVMRQTDAHNKIQEESEMWKLRQWEKQMSQDKHLPATECMRGRMHCDRATDYSRDQVRSKERASGHDDRDARYWTRKLYEFEANDPDRWGHSGFKELYPEEFASDSEEASSTKNGHHKKKKSSTDAAKPKRSKKSSRKKKKKKKKKNEEEKRKRVESSSSSDESSAIRCKEGRKRTKSKHKNKKRERNREREKDSSSEESDDEGERERRTRSRKKRKQDSHKGSDSGVDSQKRRRKNWKAANEENTDDSSGD